MPKVLLQGNNILIAPLQANALAAQGIEVPEKYRADPLQFRVLAVGPGRVVRKKGKEPIRIPHDIEVGDCVLLPQVHGNKLAMPNGVQIIEADEIIAKWKPAPPKTLVEVFSEEEVKGR